MSSNAEEQASEMEALQSMFPEELELLSDDAFRLRVTADGGQHSLLLQCFLPAEYPSTLPPVIELYADWLNDINQQEMTANLESLFVPGEVVVFNWFEWLKERVAAKNETVEAGNVATNDVSAGQGSDVQHQGEDQGQEGGECVSDDLLEEMMAYSKFVVNEEEEWAHKIVHGDTIIDRKSVFQAHVAGVRSREDVQAMQRYLMSNNKIARATHNIMAYRLTLSSGIVMGDCDDDGEDAAGGRLLHLLVVLDARDVCVVVSRWYGGIQLGADRFKHINNAARNILTANPHLWTSGSTKAKEGSGKASKAAGKGST